MSIIKELFIECTTSVSLGLRVFYVDNERVNY